jgi:anti-sigma regulatory factor (Ser/Thr protein kinase)
MKKLGEAAVAAGPASLPEVKGLVTSAAAEHGLSAGRADEVARAVEEAFLNIGDYAYQGKPGEVLVACATDNLGRFTVILTDFAPPFNALLASDPLLAEENQALGLKPPSVRILKRFITNIEYKRIENKNILTLIVAREAPG